MAWTVVGNIRGPAGLEGPQGTTGAQGPTGAAGQDGADGADGAAGAAGPASLNFRFAWDNAQAYVIAADGTRDAVAWGGSTYFVTADHAALADEPPTGTTATPDPDDSAVNAGWQVLSLQGATGATGAAGAAGAQGSQGIQGPAGDDGATGAQGATGSTGSQGSQGTQGVQGVQGPQGTQGAAGARGSQWFTGEGAPGTIGGSLPGDQYLDLDDGTVYTLS